MTTAKLLELNPGYTADSVLSLGKELNVTDTEPYVEVEVHYETKDKQQSNLRISLKKMIPCTKVRKK